MTDAEIEAIISELRERETALPIRERMRCLERRTADALDDIRREFEALNRNRQAILDAIDDMREAMEYIRQQLDPDT